MEIQDRNSLLQILVGAKEVKTQIAFDGNSFVDVLNSAKTENVFQSKAKEVDVKGVEFDRSVKADITTDIKKNDKIIHENGKGKEASKKTEDKTVDNTKGKENKTKEKEKVEEEKAVGVNQVANENKTVEDKEELKTDNKTEVVEESISEVEGSLKLQDILLSEVVLQNVENGVLNNVLEEDMVVVDDVAVSNNSEIVLNKVEEPFILETSKQEHGEALKSMMQDFVPLSEEEGVLMEQMKYFDEKIAIDKKFKIEVNVSEEKNADPVVKDVLKNRFEIDSMFQTVEDVAQTKTVDAEIVLEDNVQNVADETQNIHELKNSVYGEVKIVQENVKTIAAKDSIVASVSNKEIIAEVANVSRNETFAKINETSSRDVYKGMAKEVIEQIKINITKSAVKGVDTVDIQLKPEDLGKVQIKMHIAKDGKIQAEIIASRAETADILQKDVSSLSKAFNDAGYDTDAKSFTFSFQNENHAKGQEKDDSGLLKFIGDALEQEAENIAGNDNLGYDPVLGLNIRV